MDTNKKPNPSNEKSNDREKTGNTSPDKRNQGGSQEKNRREGEREHTGNR